MATAKTELEAQLLEVAMADARETFESDVDAAMPDDAKREGVERSKARFEKNGGYQVLYAVETGEAVYPPVSVIAHKMLTEFNEKGARVWSLEPPKGRRYKKDPRTGRRMLVRPDGDYYCPLHPDSPERAVLDEIGFKPVVCKSSKRLNDVASRDRHFEHKHSGAWKAWERHLVNERERRAEAREERMAQLIERLTEARIAQALGPEDK